MSAAYARVAAAWESLENAAKNDPSGCMGIAQAANAVPTIPLPAAMPSHASTSHMHASVARATAHNSASTTSTTPPTQTRPPAQPTAESRTSQAKLSDWYAGSTTVHKKGMPPRVIPALGPPKPHLRAHRFTCCFKSRGCSQTSDHGPAMKHHEKNCEFKPPEGPIITLKSPFCLDAQIRRRDQLKELADQLSNAVSESVPSPLLSNASKVQKSRGCLRTG